jgi:flavodoxin
MTITKVWAVYFSATGTTKKVAEAVAETIAAKAGAEYGILDFTLPGVRTEPLRFHAGELVVFGTPVIAGRVPNVLLKYLDTLSGGGALAVPVVLYGNRDYDDALIELRDILTKGGLQTIAAAAFVGEHSFSETLAKGRPDAADMAAAVSFANAVFHKLVGLTGIVGAEPISVKERRRRTGGTTSPGTGREIPSISGRSSRLPKTPATIAAYALRSARWGPSALRTCGNSPASASSAAPVSKNAPSGQNTTRMKVFCTISASWRKASSGVQNRNCSCKKRTRKPDATGEEQAYDRFQ